MAGDRLGSRVPELVRIQPVELDQVDEHQDQEEAHGVKRRLTQGSRRDPRLVQVPDLQEATKAEEGQLFEDHPEDQARDQADGQQVALFDDRQGGQVATGHPENAVEAELTAALLPEKVVDVEQEGEGNQQDEVGPE